MDERPREARRKKGKVEPERLPQVWFAGMHADVGGGYPDDGLSFVPLCWMIEEAADKGLRFEPSHRHRVSRARLADRAHLRFARRHRRVLAVPAARGRVLLWAGQHATCTRQRHDADGAEMTAMRRSRCRKRSQ